MKQYFVPAGEVAIWVRECGNPDRPTLMFVHGFPDDHRVWSSVIEQLESDYHILALDLRGAGNSTRPEDRRAYRIDRILPDFAAVLDAAAPGKKVHLIGHDWGSVLCWSFVSEPAYANRLASYTSLSGPHVGLLWQWINQRLRSGPSGIRKALAQLSHSWYIFAIHVPKLPETLFGPLGKWVWPHTMKQGGVPDDDDYLEHSEQEIRSVALDTLQLYRQNVFSPPRLPEPGSITLPVQLILLQQDPFVRPYIFSDIERYAVNLTRRTLEASHWAPRSHPLQVAQLIDRYLKSLDRAKENAA
ncbi:MAG: alpha/beta hydrolase [Pseudomonadales bacterium]|uniref:alpha/beta fold hydrolase n=2 Tax=Gammaproteobacteria TaxID=1236 RepID=UPI000C3ED4A1|nr:MULTISPECIES: alpha/beta fold hydrolase [unclassified Ketobacter]MAQ23499.1 alpha/beta hydrolase [Pseudomonadales bacterium]MEC8813354.1 alpha/beta fold hydrolase [Pseudomonadota bacterium]TNC89317.1 MAG: alpha/beta hydrolase [Alcanivorax sp.]HAG94608.1 alpha/beta hydrolase [Gammaproteobacteria bacterium]MBI27417.1 alpha/beta hydrolase [Pseudomonadales bacterium]